MAACGRFVDSLHELHFNGEVLAIPDEPIVRVVAPLPQARLVETRVIMSATLGGLDSRRSNGSVPVTRCMRQVPG